MSKQENVVKVKLTGINSLLMHNGQLANPLNPVTQAMKKISGKRNKTEADFEELSRLEFQGGLYMDDDGPIIPDLVFEACLIKGAMKSKEGPKAKSGVFVQSHGRLEYNGPRDREGLWDDKRFVDVRPVVVSRSRIMRTRPIFHDWSVEFEIEYLPDIVDKNDIIKWAENAGRLVGLCELRPRLGRFEVSNGS